MTTKEYIIQQFGSFGIQLSEAELVDLCNGKTDEPYLDNKKDMQIAIVKYIPTLLLRPNVSENGFSISWDKKALRDFYSLRCKELGIKDKLTPQKPTVRFL